MDLSEFSRRGGRARTPAKTAANRAKLTAYWIDVRAGRRPPPRRRRKFTPEILRLASRYVWWKKPAESLKFPRHVIARTLNLGTFAEYALLERFFGRVQLRATMQFAEPGWFSPPSWTYWHYRLRLTPWGAQPPPLPRRVVPDHA